MSTPQPPFPAVESTAQQVQPGLSQAARVINIFFAPRKTFADIRLSASWWLPWIIFALVLTAFTFTMGKKVGYDAVVNNMISHASMIQRATDQMTPEKRQEFVANLITRQERGIYYAWINPLIACLILAGLLLLTFNFGFDAQLKYKHALAIVFYAWLPKIVLFLLAIVVMMLGVEPEGFDPENPIATHLGVLLGSNSEHRFLYHLLSSFDLFSCWIVFLLGLGFVTVSAKKISTTTAVVTVAAWYLAFDLLRVAVTPFIG